MRDGMSIIKTYTSETEAQFALNHLLAMDIKAMIQKDNCGGMRPHMDISIGVDILVADEQREQALAVLEAPQSDSVTEPWNCSACGEDIEAGFDACWKCGNEKQTL